MNRKTKTSIIIMVSLLWGCTVSDQVAQLPKHHFYAKAGLNHGGIVENTDMAAAETTPPDGYSGATKVGLSAGAHYEYRLRNNAVEVGALVLTNPQDFTYHDATQPYSGTRHLFTTQLRLPLTYNFTLWRNAQYEPLIQLKVGMAPGYAFTKVTDNDPNLPTYTANGFSNGFNFGLQVMPFTLQNKSMLGFGVDVYRGGQIYDDFYQKGEVPGSSFANFSVVYKFK